MIHLTVSSNMASAHAKTAAIKKMPLALKTNLTGWAGETVKYIRNSYKGGNVFRRPPKDIDQNLSFVYTSLSDMDSLITIGTGGYVGKKEVVYADIQERGGTVRPKGHPFLTVPMPGVKGRAANYPDAFLAISAKGQYMIAQSTGKKKGGLKVLFLLRRQVTLPPRHWFSTPIKERLPALDAAKAPAAVWATALKLAGVQANREG